MSFGFGFSLPAYIGYGGGFGAGATLVLDFTSGNQTLDPRITFSRASNATVTNQAGTLVYAPHNLLTFSESFDASAWGKFAASVTANTAVAPDGTTTADKVIESSGAAAEHGTNRSSAVAIPAGSQITLSVYSKADTRNRVAIALVNGTYTIGAQYTFNLVTGTVGTVSLTGTPISHSASIQNVGSGWYRCVITAVLDTSSTTANFNIATDNGSTFFYAGDGTSGLFIWGAQLNVGALQPYYTTTVKNLLGYSQEFDNAAWTKSNSFVQTNLLLQSENFSASWSLLRMTNTSDALVSPDSRVTADLLLDTAVAGTHVAIQTITKAASSIIYTASVYLKAGVRTLGELRVSDQTGNGVRNTFNLSTGTVGIPSAFGTGFTAGTSTITAAGNGWYRVDLVATSNSATTLGHEIYIADGSGNTSYTGNGSGLYAWGAQLVQGATAGDYQVTYGAARAVMYSAPDGSVTADKIVPNTTSADHLVATNAGTATSGTTYTLSVYAKASEYGFIRLSFGNVAGGGYTFFNVSNGTVGTTSGMAANEIVSVGGGWYRCSVRRAAGSTALIGGDIYIVSADNQFTWAGDGTSGIFIWGAQLSDSASLDPYSYNPVAAPTAAAYYGPRFDYNPVTLAPNGLLIEEQRTNLLTFSEQFDNAAWTKFQSSVTANAATAPDGTQSADKFIPDATLNGHYLISSVTSMTSGTTYVGTVYAKAAEQTVLQLTFQGATHGSTYFANFSLSTGALGSSGGAGVVATVSPAGNGWYRCSIAAPATATASGGLVVLSAASLTDGRLPTYTGTGTGGIFVYGAQLEAGAFATSYIPTTTAAATRAADVATMQGANFSNWYNQSEGALYGEFAVPPGLANFPSTAGAASDGTTNNQISPYAHTSGLYTNIKTGNVTQGDPGVIGSPVVGAATKFAIAYQTNNSVSAWNATVGTVDTSVTLPTLNQFRIGANGAGAGLINSHIRRIAYYPRRLANTELQALTT